MNDDIRRRIGVMRGETLSVKVPPGVVPDDHDDHSFTTISVRPDEDAVTVTLEAGRTRLRVDGVEAVFDGFRYFPRNPDDYDTVDYRGDPGDANVDFAPDDGTDTFPERLIDTIHPVTDTTVEDLIDGLESGKVEPLPKRYTEE